MRIPRIYTPQLLTNGQTLQLDEGPSHHIGKVLRMQAGRELVLFNGAGGEYTAAITEVGKRQVAVNITGFSAGDRESPLAIELAIGISRGERMDWVLQKATELGVTRITPLLTERTEVKLKGDRQDKKGEHWQQIVISACEQCQRNRLPQLSAAQTLQDFLPGVSAAQKYVLHHRTATALAGQQQPASVCLLIGPEGGLSDREIQAAEQAGFSALALGPRVFRTETAPIAALSVLQYLWGDLG